MLSRGRAPVLPIDLLTDSRHAGNASIIINGILVFGCQEKANILPSSCAYHKHGDPQKELTDSSIRIIIIQQLVEKRKGYVTSRLKEPFIGRLSLLFILLHNFLFIEQTFLYFS